MVRGRSIELAAEQAEMKKSRWTIEKRQEFWKSDDGCTMITGMVREGMKPADIAMRIGISPSTFARWMEKFPEIDKAVREGSELNDYRVENALLRSALGYKSKHTTVTTVMRYGKVVETQRVDEEVDVPPNVKAINTWLYNRRPEQWQPESKIAGSDSDSDGALEVEVVRVDEASSRDNADMAAEAKTERQKMIDELSTDPDGDQSDPDWWPEDWEDEDDWGEDE